jgi:transposase-like protein
MKTQLSKPARHNARYTQEYKQEALQFWRNSGRSAAKVAAKLGIRPPLLYRWAHLERDHRDFDASHPIYAATQTHNWPTLSLGSQSLWKVS